MNVWVGVAITRGGNPASVQISGETSATPGLIVAPAYLGDEESREQARRARELNRRFFHSVWCQVIHQPSGALIGTFFEKKHAIHCAARLGFLPLDWTEAREVIIRVVRGTSLREQISNIVSDCHGRELKRNDFVNALLGV